MGASGTATVGLSIRGTPPTLPDLSGPYNTISIPLSGAGDSNWTWQNGTGVGQINLLWHGRVTAAVGSLSIDCAALESIFQIEGGGEDVGFAALKLVYFRNRSLTQGVYIAGDVESSAPTPPPWSAAGDTQPVFVEPAGSVAQGSIMLLIAGSAGGYTVTDGVNNIVSFTTLASTAEVDIMLGGIQS